MRLSKQSIRRLCVGVDNPMIHPFEPSKVRVQGVSKGLSHASYDASIAHDLVLGRHPGYVIKEWFLTRKPFVRPDIGIPKATWINRGLWVLEVPVNLPAELEDLRKRLRDEPPAYSLAHTIEDFHMPDNVGGDVADKSTFARVFVSAYNTFFDPGFHGNATLELVNDSDKRVEYKAGQGVCQFIFSWLDEPTEEPYSGKYQGQTKAAHAARYEADDQGQRARDYAERRDLIHPAFIPTEGAQRHDLLTGEREVFRDGKWVASKPDAEGTVLHKRTPSDCTAAEVQANQDRLNRHRAKDEGVGQQEKDGMHEAAVRTLGRLGWSYLGGVEWKPPLGKPPTYVDPELAVKVEEWVQRGGVPFVQGLYDAMRGDQPQRMQERNKELYGHKWGDKVAHTGGTAPHPAPVAGCTAQEQAANLSRYRWGDKPSGLDKYAGHPDHAVRGWEPK